jgi:hypothetical protein
MKLKRIVLLLALLLIQGSALSRVSAQSSSGFTVTPSLSELNLQAGKGSAIDYTVKNLSGSTINVTPTFSNFLPQNDGVPKIQEDTATNTYGLKDWFKSTTALSVTTGSSKVVTISFTVPSNALNQTYFGVVVFKSDVKSAGKDVSIASLVFVNVGTPKFAGSVTSTKVGPPSANGSVVIDLTVQNTGAYKFTPTTKLEVQDSAGKVVSTLEPTGTGSVLPNSARLYTFNYTSDSAANKDYEVMAKVTLPDGTALAGATKEALYNPPTTSAVVKKAVAAVPKKTMFPLIYILVGVALAVLAFIGIMIMKRKKHPASPAIAAPQAIQTTPIDNSVVQPNQDAGPQVIAPANPAPPPASNPEPQVTDTNQSRT